MGQVFRAVDTTLGRDVALKLLPAEMASNPESLARFQREARVVASLNHPHIVTIFSVEQSDGVHFLTMELVQGQSLDKLIRGSMQETQIIQIALAIADALAAAHAKGIAHRDLKPANVMVSDDGWVKVLDFGLAKDLNAEVGEHTISSADITKAGAVMGTPAYMSPEQISGRPLDQRTDIFSLGVVMHEMATGRRPFAGSSTAELISAILRDTPPPVTDLRPDLPPGLTQLIHRCLAKNLENRVQTAREVGKHLREISGSAPGSGSRIAATVDSASDATITSGFITGSAERVSARPQDASPPSAAKSGTPQVTHIERRVAWKLPALVALLLFAGVAGYFVWHAKNRGAPAPVGSETAANSTAIRSIAVLPLDNYSGDPKQDYFAEGMTDELTTELATLSQIRVISRGSVAQFKGEHRPPTSEIAKLLNVDAVVEGSVIRSGDKVRITAQLIDARADTHLWAGKFERQSSDVLALQDELASSIAREIHVQLTPTEATRLSTAPHIDPEAHDAYLKGRYFFNRPSDENLKRAIAEFEKAVRLDPKYALAYSGLSDAYLWAGYNEGVLSASQAKPKAKAAAERAIELDDDSAEAHTSLAVYKMFYEFDWAGCEKEYRRAFVLNPNYAFAHDQFGLGLAFQGRFSESTAEGKLASQLDPLDPQFALDNVIGLAWKGDYAAAHAETKRASELDPTFFFPAWGDGWIDLQQGNAGASITEFQKSTKLEAPDFVSAWLAYAYGSSGDRTHALAELEKLKKISPHGHVLPFNLALVYLGMGDHARALDQLEKANAADSQWQGWLGQDHVFDPLRSEPRFVALLKKLGFKK
jgi:serine/threonine protein kinase/TolB-like protein/Tfp pilus assembly protein PilF